MLYFSKSVEIRFPVLIFQYEKSSSLSLLPSPHQTCEMGLGSPQSLEHTWEFSCFLVLAVLADTLELNFPPHMVLCKLFVFLLCSTRGLRNCLRRSIPGPWAELLYGIGIPFPSDVLSPPLRAGWSSLETSVISIPDLHRSPFPFP